MRILFCIWQVAVTRRSPKTGSENRKHNLPPLLNASDRVGHNDGITFKGNDEDKDLDND